jgi:hypothetical protein
VTWAFVTGQEALDRLGEPHYRDSDLRASRPDHTLDRNEPARLDLEFGRTGRLNPETLWMHTAITRRPTPTTTRHGNRPLPATTTETRRAVNRLVVLLVDSLDRS